MPTLLYPLIDSTNQAVHNKYFSLSLYLQILYRRHYFMYLFVYYIVPSEKHLLLTVT